MLLDIKQEVHIALDGKQNRSERYRLRVPAKCRAPRRISWRGAKDGECPPKEIEAVSQTLFELAV
ncbi:MAG TPA: hypothetical protein VI957_00440 [Candidatus Paceibacterota bacterium]